METSFDHQWLEYIETPTARRLSCPVKIDRILNERMKAFLRVKEARQARAIDNSM